MDPDSAAQLGQHLRQRRNELGWSAKTLADKCDTRDTTVLRIELGEFAAPSADTLARMAEALGLSVGDVYARAGYVTPNDLPTLGPYLHSQYRDLPDDAIERIENYINRLVKQHGATLAGPETGQDERPDGDTNTTI